MPENRKEMSVHDACVQDLVGALLARTRHEIRCEMRSGPNQAANTSGPDGLACPDIVLVDGKLGTPVEFHEVEAHDSVTEQRRDERWLPYAEALPPLHLYVPVDCLDDAMQLTRTLRENAKLKLHTWSGDPVRGFSFQW